MTDPWVVVPCSAAKRPEADLPAIDRYTGSLHQMAMAAALALTPADRVRIASAKYGLLELKDPTVPYDMRLDALNFDDLRAWQSRVHCDAIGMLNIDKAAAGFRLWDNQHLDAMAPVVALVPAAYAEAMRSSPLLARTMVTPLAGLGIGRMRGRLAAIRDSGTFE